MERKIKMNIYEENLNANYHNYTFGPYLATDDLGRALPTSEETGPQRKNRHVGMFYFLWNGVHVGDKRPLDISKIIAAFPKAGYYPDMDIWGAYSVMHHWGEPLFGYYYTEDEWVMRKHIEMLTIADIDFLVFDTTNAVIYERNAKMMMRLLNEYRQAGWNTPKVVFYTNTRSGYTAQLIYDAIYKVDFMPDTWFYLDGKPLIIAKEDECSEEVRNLFTIRASQWPNEPTKLNGWPWMDFERPQRVLKNHRGEEEIINVSVAQHPQIRFGDSALYGEESNRGRSYHNGANDKSEGAYKYGYNFAEQWERALETDPPYVFVTGWNEWIAGRWQGTAERPLNFVDCADIEFSRDIEPMKGGYFDNYYMQLIYYVRKYKGTQPIIRQEEMETASIADCFARFNRSKVVYRDFPKGAMSRNCKGYDTVYTNNTGRNEIIESRVLHDEHKIYFYAKTSAPIERYDYQSAWMNLFLNVNEGKNDDKRFHGYNYLVNAYQYSETRTSLSKCTEDAKVMSSDTFKICGMLEYKYDGNEIMIEIPKKAIGIEPGSKFRILFKWVDSRTEIYRMEQFYTDGDCAPIGRLNYVFEN